MPRAGRALEEVVALLEGMFAGTGVRIRSPEYIEGRQSGSRREVDVSVRGPLGGSQLLVIIECRDREGRQDVTWIGELATKREDVGADRAVAVSASGFSAGAKNLAAQKGIELREFEELGPGVVLSWLGIDELRVHGLGAESRHMSVDLVADEPGLSEGHTFSDQGFILERGGEQVGSLSSFGLWLMVSDRKGVYDDIPTDGTRKRVRLTANLHSSNPEDRVLVDTGVGLAEVRAVYFDVEAWIEEKMVPVSALTRYVGPDVTLTETALFEFEMGGQRMLFGLHFAPGQEGLGATLITEPSAQEIGEEA